MRLLTTFNLKPKGELHGDHAPLFSALKEVGGAGRGIIEGLNDVDRLPEYFGAGIRGIRFAPRLKQGGALQRILEFAPLLKASKMHVQIYANIDELPSIADGISRAGLTIVLDHFARLPPDQLLSSKPLDTVRRLLDRGACWLKLSGPYHLSASSPRFDDLADLAMALFRTNPDRIIWGSDWPHPNSSVAPTEHDLFQTLESWGFNG